MNTSRRIRLFVMGVLLGSIIMYFFVFKNRNVYKSPSEVIHGKLQSQHLEYSRHAQCRMQCRSISESEIKEILQNGEVNYSKSQVHDKPCPSYALEGKTADGQNVRIVFAECETVTKVITAIDLDTDHDTCDCK
jgi:Domain of unknown function (DUF4258)